MKLRYRSKVWIVLHIIIVSVLYLIVHFILKKGICESVIIASVSFWVLYYSIYFKYFINNYDESITADGIMGARLFCIMVTGIFTTMVLRLYSNFVLCIIFLSLSCVLILNMRKNICMFFTQNKWNLQLFFTYLGFLLCFVCIYSLLCLYGIAPYIALNKLGNLIVTVFLLFLQILSLPSNNKMAKFASNNFRNRYK